MDIPLPSRPRSGKLKDCMLASETLNGAVRIWLKFASSSKKSLRFTPNIQLFDLVDVRR